MADHSSDPSDTDGLEDPDSTEHDHERIATREECATVLRRLADDVANGSVELGGDDGFTVTVPERIELEIEYETEEEEAELDVELEWPIVEGDAVAAERDAERPERDEPVDVAEGADDVPIDEVVGAGDAASRARFELYRDRADEWRWRLVHDNGNVIADSGEGYNRKATARKGLRSVMRNAPGARVVEDVD